VSDAPIRMPVLFSEALDAEIIDRVKRGQRPVTAAAACGVPPAVWRDWVARAQNHAEPWCTFYACVRAAEADARGRAQEQVAIDAPAAWLRTLPPDEMDDSAYQPESRVQVSGRVQHAHAHVVATAADLRELSDAQLRGMLEAPDDSPPPADEG
jgi:hypothetical protein